MGGEAEGRGERRLRDKKGGGKGAESWSGLPFPPPGDLSDPGIKATFPALPGRFFTTEIPVKPKELVHKLDKEYSKLNIKQLTQLKVDLIFF